MVLQTICFVPNVCRLAADYGCYYLGRSEAQVVKAVLHRLLKQKIEN